VSEEQKRRHEERRNPNGLEKRAVLDISSGAKEEERDDEGELAVGEELACFDLANSVRERHLVNGPVERRGE
jgi:hypothetical protein